MRDTSRARARVAVAEANELVLSLSVAAEHSSNATAATPAGRVARFAPSGWMWAHLVSVVFGSPPPHDAAAFLVALDRLPALEVQRRLVGYYTSWFRARTPTEVIDRALRGNAAACRAFVGSAMPEDPTWTRSLQARLEAGPLETKRELLDVIEAWHGREFAQIARSTRALRAVVRARRRRAASPREFVRALAGTAPLTCARGGDVVVIPSVALREDVHDFDHASTRYLCVPIEVRRTEADAELRRLLHVLADGSRLDIVASLAEGHAFAQELADRAGLTLSTTLHHLRALREAGVVAGGGRRRRYVLQRAPLRRLRVRLGALADRGSIADRRADQPGTGTRPGTSTTS